MNKILIIEDDLEINALLADFLKEKGYAVHCQYDGLHVLDFLNKEKIQNVVNTSEKIISSEKVGDFQRNFSTVSIAYLISLASNSNVQKEIKAEIEKYLIFTGLLYGGMNVR